MTSRFGYCKADPNIPIDELDFGYIEKCKDINKLQKILEILRSGDEGRYPALEQFTEKQLAKKKPDSPLLQKCIQEKMTRDMPKEYIRKTVDDLKNLSSYCYQPENLENVKANLPPIRSSKKAPGDVKERVQEEGPSNVPNHVTKLECTKGPVNCENLSKQVHEDGDKESKNTCAAKSANHLKNTDSKLAHGLPTHQLNLSSLINDPNIVAKNEKNKGNEAFYSGDYQEALMYYNRSLDILPSATSFNNRAITLIKLGEFWEALEDCEKVISLEPNNMKAYMRRGIANQSLGLAHEAYADFSKVLELEPSNKRGKELLQKVSKELEKGNLNPKKKGKRMKIEDIHTNAEPITMADKNNENKESSNTSSVTPAILPSNENKSTEFLVNAGKDNEMEHCVKVDIRDNHNETNSFVGEEEKDSSTEICSLESKKDNVGTEIIFDNKSNNLNTFKEDEQCDINSRNNVGANIDTVLELPVNIIEMKNKGNILYKRGQYDEACAMYTSCIDILIDDKPNYREALSTLLSNRSSCLMKMGNAKQSVYDCDLSIVLLQTSNVYRKRACAYESLEKYVNAYLDYEHALKLDPSSVIALQASTRLASILRSQYGGSWREKLHSSDTRYLNMSPVATDNTNQCNDKTSSREIDNITHNTQDEHSDKMISLQKDNILINNRSQTVYSADEALSKSEIKQKSSCHNGSKKAVKVDAEMTDHNASIDNGKKSGLGNSRTSQNELTKEQIVLDFFSMKEKGNNCVQQGNYQEAITCYTKCAELLPKEVPIYTNRAFCYLKLKQATNAIQDCSHALTLEARCVKALFRRAKARRMTKEYTGALADLTEVLKIEPNNNAIKKEMELCKAEFHDQLRNIQAQNEAAKNKDSSGDGKRVLIEEVDSTDITMK